MELTSNNNIDKVRSLLEAGKRITVLTVFNECQTLECKHYIYLLRKQGMLIKDQWIKRNEKRFKTWFL